MSAAAVVPEKMDDLGRLLCRYLDWDSNFFGIRIARVETDYIAPDNTPEILAWCSHYKIDCLYFLSSSSDSVSIRMAEDCGFRLVDVRVTLERKPIDSSLDSFGNPDFSIRSANTDDLPVLRSIARISFHDTRFYFDPHFPRQLCDSFYETWIDVSVNGYTDTVLVAVGATGPAGFITCKLSGKDVGEIGLLGVAESQQGKGAARMLVNAGLTWFKGQGVQQVKVVTQGRNISAQRLYQRCGFVSFSNQLWFHKWFEGEV